MKIASLFSGIGGFEKGILQANPNAEIVFASEINPYARKIYTKNYGVEPYGDITKIKATDIPDHDILCGGFPCQAFSVAGLRRGFEDCRGTLFFEIMRIVEVKQPKLLFLENVPGLLSHDEGKTFHTILESMDEMGYDAEWQVFNSRNHGVPQNRERVFIIGHLRGAGTQPIFPITKNDESVNDVQEQHTNCLTARYEGAQATGSYIIENKFDAQIKCHTLQPRSSKLPGGSGPLNREDGNSYCLDTGNCMAIEIPTKKVRIGNPEVTTIQPYLREWLKISGVTIAEIERVFGNRAPHHWFEKIEFASLPDVDQWIKLKSILKFDNVFDNIMTEHQIMTEYDIMVEHKKRHELKGNGFGIKENTPNDIANTVTTFAESTQILKDENLIRRLTPIECERLQGFPDNWTDCVSDAQRYKCLGNAVTVNVIEFIARRLFKMQESK